MSPWYGRMETKPLHSWPGKRRTRFDRAQFSTNHSDTIRQLQTELRHLRASSAIIELDITDGDIRNDGWPRASAKVPPAVKLTIAADGEPDLVFATDRFGHWHDNLRAITLGLESLRRIERYGITDSGDPYAGWKALPSGEGPTTFDDAAQELAEIMLEHGRGDGSIAMVKEDPGWAVREAQKATHPDITGGDDAAFKRVQVLAERIGA